MTDFLMNGAPEIDRALKALPAKIEKNIMRGAIRAGLREMQLDAKARVPVRSGALRSSIRIKVRVNRGKILAQVIAGSFKAYYAHIVEGGAKPHAIKPKKAKALALASTFAAEVDHPGTDAEPFMKPAFDSKVNAAIHAVTEYAKARLAREAEKR